jgi:2-dehydro-3-deoxygluconokinase
MYDVVALGEAMLRLSPPNFMRLEQTHSFDVNVGGTEVTTCVGVARFGLKTAWVSKLAKSPLGRLVTNKAREHGIDTSHIVWSDEGRMGIYYLELGSTPRASEVFYDRKDSAVSRLGPGEVNWPAILKGTKIFLTSGITTALSPTCREAAIEAINEAKRQGCKICFDINYRAKLWSAEEAKKCLSKILDKVDILVTTQFDTEDVFGYKGSYEDIAKQLKDKFGCSIVAITLRDVRTVLTGSWTSIALADKLYKGKTYDLEIVDMMGTGDGYTIGFIYGYLTGDVEKAVAYGDALAALEHSVPGDFSWFTEDEVKKQIKAVGYKIQR